MRKLILAFLLLLVPSVARAVPAFDAASGTFVNGSLATITIPFTTTGSNRWMNVCGTAGGVVITGVTYNGDAMGLLADLTSIGQHEGGWYGLVNPDTGGALNVVVTLASGGADVVVGVSSYTGVNQSSPTDTVVSLVDVVQTIDVTASSAVGDLVVDCLTHSGNIVTLAATSPQVERNNEDNTDHRSIAMSEKTGAATVNMQWTWGSSFEYVALGAVSLNPAVVAGSTAARGSGRVLE